MKYLRQAIISFVVLTIIMGIIYPLFIYVIGQGVFPYQANGSIIMKDNQAIGSALIGQQFTQDKYFWSRPSATANYPYNALASGGSNLGPLNPQLMASVKDRVKQLQITRLDVAVPIDLVTASGSGLDPEISLAAAYFQVERVAKARNLRELRVLELVSQQAKAPIMGFFGEARVNVLQLNLALDNLQGN